MTTAVGIAVVILVLVAANVWVHLGPGHVHVVTGPLAACLLLVFARTVGLTWQELGLGRPALARGLQSALVAFAAVAVVYAAAVAIPFTRVAFRDTRYRVGPRAALYTALVAIPLGTVLFEEVAFRSVLWGMLARDHGQRAATVGSALVFGIWHVLPATNLARTHTSVRGLSVAALDRRRIAFTVLATIVFTTLAGIVFAELRRRTGSLAALIGLHWATNGLGVLAAARVWGLSSSGDSTPDAPASELVSRDAAAPDVVSRNSASADTLALPAPLTQPAWKRVVGRLRSSRS